MRSRHAHCTKADSDADEPADTDAETDTGRETDAETDLTTRTHKQTGPVKHIFLKVSEKDIESSSGKSIGSSFVATTHLTRSCA